MILAHGLSTRLLSAGKPSEVHQKMDLEDDFTTPSELDFWPVLTLPFLQFEARNPD